MFGEAYLALLTSGNQGVLIRGSVSCSSWVPVFADQEQRLAVMSIGFLLQHQDEAVVWRGPKKNGGPVEKPPRQLSVVAELSWWFSRSLDIS